VSGVRRASEQANVVRHLCDILTRFRERAKERKGVWHLGVAVSNWTAEWLGHRAQRTEQVVECNRTFGHGTASLDPHVDPWHGVELSNRAVCGGGGANDGGVGRDAGRWR
jgi:hypothetical protein